MSQNITPRPFAALLSFAHEVHQGVLANSDRLTLRQHDAESIGADLDQFRTSISTYQRCVTAHAAQREALRAATAEAKTWCARTVDTLKVHLGRRWNAEWRGAGFENGSIAIPKEYHTVLLSLAAHFRLHPEREVPALNITADHLTAIAAAWAAAKFAACQAHDEEVTAKQVRDAARTQLRRRIAGVRNELAFLLRPDDGRWYLFGFNRPSAGQIPEPVEEITIRPLPEDAAEMTWQPSARAINYRISKQVIGRDAEPVEIGLVADPTLLIRGLPADAEVVFFISARNRAGETVRTRVTWSRQTLESGL